MISRFAKLALTGLLTLLIFNLPGSSETEGADLRKEDGFINQGPVSVSQKFTLAKDTSFIIFKIRNNTTYTISNIYGWVLKFKEGENSKVEILSLVNNPHRGGVLIKGHPHGPGKSGEWRFPLLKGVSGPEKNEKFMLQVNQKSVFYSRAEPDGISELSSEKKKNKNQ